MTIKLRLVCVIGLCCCWQLALGCGDNPSGGPGNSNGNGDGQVSTGDGGDLVDAAVGQDSGSTECVGGTDVDGDGYGPGCPLGADCDDANPQINPAATELCNGVDDNCDGDVDEGVLTACGNCSTNCSTDSIGTGPFPMPGDDPEHVDADGVGLDPNGDLVLDQSSTDGNFMWIANENDWGRGSVSKVDSASMMEVARYFTVTCDSNPATPECDDVDDVDPGWGAAFNIPFGSTLINPAQNNRPSRTAMDYNGDVWVANRAFGVQASVTKIANNITDCLDRNGNGVIDTSHDVDGNGFITTDCDGNGVPDDINTVCTNGLSEPEFLGLDDECVLFTTNIGVTNDVARAIAIDGGDPYSGGAGNAWVPTHMRTGPNILLKVDGASGEIVAGWEMPVGMNAYGAAVDGHGILWLTDYPWDAVYLLYFDTNTETMGTMIPNGFWDDPLCQNVSAGSPRSNHYGIGLDSEHNVWLGGWNCGAVFRYRPDRTTFATIAQGAWTRVRFGMGYMRGIAADKREVGGVQHHNFIWSAVNSYGGVGYVARVPQWILDGDYACSDLAPECDVFPLTGDGVIGCGVAFDGNIWGISHSNNHATRLLVDANGDVLNPNPWRNTTDVYDLTDDAVQVGTNPYTYSDFTGFGLKTFTRPRGTYRYIMEGCAAPNEANWRFIEWNSTEPQGTSILVRARSSEDGVTWGDWSGPWAQSPASLFDPADPLAPNPALYLQVEFELTTLDSQETPILHDFDIIWQCDNPVG